METERYETEHSRYKHLEILLAALERESPLLTSEITTPTQSAALMDLLTWFEQCRPEQVCSRTWLECQTALVEAYANVLEHAHQGMPAETPILIKLAIYRQAIQIQVWDHGAAFDLLDRLQSLPDRVAVTAEHGRGLLLLRRTMDDLTYFRSPDDRNCLMMIKEL